MRYRVKRADVGRRLRVVVRARNRAGWGRAVVSRPTAVVRARVVPKPPADPTLVPLPPPMVVHATSPAKVADPVLEGEPLVGAPLTARPGSWTGFPQPTVGHRWERCATAGGSCAAIDGATGVTYTPVEADAGAVLRVVETAVNVAGAASATATASRATWMAPQLIERPTVGGVAQVGETLRSDAIRYDGFPAPTTTLRWERCDAQGKECAAIDGARAPDYAPVAADAGATLRLRVTVANAAGTVTTHSDPTGAVTMAPTPVGTLTIAGMPVLGEPLTADGLTWAGHPEPTVTYRWERCAALTDCTAIAGSTGSTYTPTSPDRSINLRLTVTATNAVGTASIDADVGPIGDLPSISGMTLAAESSEAALNESLAPRFLYGGTPSPRLVYQWQRCDLATEACADIADAIYAGYRAAEADVGALVRVVVTVVNEHGSVTATSNGIPVSGAPVLTATLNIHAVAGTATVVPSTTRWRGVPTPTRTYQWLRCDSAEEATCNEIAGETAEVYTYDPLVDAGYVLGVREMASNGIGPGGSTTGFTRRPCCVFP